MVTSISHLMRSLGGAGAVANARRACDDRVRANAELDVQLARLTPVGIARGHELAA
jgi:hypothetical protein